jgi:hypothetical protein
MKTKDHEIDPQAATGTVATLFELRAEAQAQIDSRDETLIAAGEELARRQAEIERLQAALALGQVMLDSLNDENEFNPDTVHAFAVALGELAY